MAEFNWLENSQTVFEESLKAAPAPFRNATRKGLLKGLKEVVGEGGDVRESDVVQVLKAKTPGPFMAQGLNAVRPHLTDPSILDG